MALTGDADGAPLAVPTPAAEVVDDALRPFGLDAAVLAERAALLGLHRAGDRSCGGATRLLPCRDGWVALTLARPDDVDALPALFEVGADRLPTTGVGRDAPWEAAASLVADRPAADLAARAELLGVPLGVVGEGGAPFRSTCHRPSPRSAPPAPPVVVDLTSLWAGPLATSCLLRRGATVLKVEDVRRPDGARRGDPRFYDLLNAGKQEVSFDLSDEDERARLRALVHGADIVVTSSRRRALHDLGLDPAEHLAGADHRVWVALTAHGWTSDRVGFGDDIAAAAGLVAWHPDGRPRFAGDALADPLGGARAAAAALDAWLAGGRWFVDASLVGAAGDARPDGPARLAGPRGTGWAIDDVVVSPPAARDVPVVAS